MTPAVHAAEPGRIGLGSIVELVGKLYPIRVLCRTENYWIPVVAGDDFWLHAGRRSALFTHEAQATESLHSIAAARLFLI